MIFLYTVLNLLKKNEHFIFNVFTSLSHVHQPATVRNSNFKFVFKMAVKMAAAGRFRELPRSLVVNVVGGSLVCSCLWRVGGSEGLLGS